MSEANLTKAAAPKSDQLNADDLIGISRTVKITKVSGNADEKQPISIYFEGDGGKPYKPCKSMIRVLIHAWGNVAAEFIGRSMTIYRDDKVVFGGIQVGGIRISHMSNIDKEMTMALTASKASRKPYTVKPLSKNHVTHIALTDNADIPGVTVVGDAALIDEGKEAAERGTSVLQAFWERMKPTQQKSLVSYIAGWKARAAEIDQAVKDTGMENLSGI